MIGSFCEMGSRDELVTGVGLHSNRRDVLEFSLDTHAIWGIAFACGSALETLKLYWN